MLAHLHCVVLDVEVAGCAAEVGRVQFARVLHEPDHPGFVQGAGSRADQLAAVRLQQRVVLRGKARYDVI